MAILTPSIYINDDEVALKLIFVYSNKSKKSRKNTSDVVNINEIWTKSMGDS
jgi:hypothetical protein